MRHAKLALTLPALLGLAATQAHANITINANFDSSWSADPTAAADEAAINNLLATTYEANILNPTVVSLDFTDVNTGLGTSGTGYYSTDYATYDAALVADKTAAGQTADLAIINTNLTPGNNPVPGNSTAGVQYTSAQGRALGFNTPGVVTVGGVNYDSQISLNIPLINNTPPQGGPYSLTAVAAHEINEALGLGSALDNRADIAGTATVPNVGSLDFFRYSPGGARSFTSSGTAVSYFSNNGTTPIVYFNQTTGADYHDWASGDDATTDPGTVVGPPQVQDAFGDPGNNPSQGPSEVAALKDVGYNFENPSSAPEPSQVGMMALMALGLGGLLLRARKRRQSA